MLLLIYLSYVKLIKNDYGKQCACSNRCSSSGSMGGGGQGCAYRKQLGRDCRSIENFNFPFRPTKQQKKMSLTIKKNENPTEIFSKTPIENTPFLIIYNEEQKIAFGVFGKYKITKDFDNPEDVKNELSNMTWDKIITVMTLVTEMLRSQNESQNKSN